MDDLAQIGEAGAPVTGERGRMRELRARGGVVLIAALLLAGCGSGGGSEEAGGGSASSEQPTTTAEATTTEATTTTTEAEPADADTKALAEAGIYQLADLPEGWTEAVEAPEFATEGLKPDECFVPEGGVLATLPIGAVAGSPTYGSPDSPYFLTTWTAAFPDEAAAADWAAEEATPEYEECQRRLLEETSANAGGEFEVRITTLDEALAQVGTGELVRVASYELVNDGQVTSSVYVETYQVGRVLLHVTTEAGPMEAAAFELGSAAEREARGAAFERLRALE